MPSDFLLVSCSAPLCLCARSVPCQIAVALTAGKDPLREPTLQKGRAHHRLLRTPAGLLRLCLHTFQESPLLPHLCLLLCSTDDIAYIGCIFALETAMDKMKSQNEATHHLLQSVLDRLSPLQAQNVLDKI